MAVTPDDLLSPNGPLDAVLFPGKQSNELATLVQAYITSAEQDGAVLVATADRKDGMTAALALSKAFNAVYIRMNAEPLSVNVGTEKGNHAYNIEQIRNVKDLASKYFADYEALIVLPGTTPVGLTPGTLAVPTTVRW